MDSPFDTPLSNPCYTLTPDTFVRMLANVPGVQAAEYHEGATTRTAWIDAMLPGNRTLRIKSTTGGGLLFLSDFEPTSTDKRR